MRLSGESHGKARFGIWTAIGLVRVFDEFQEVTAMSRFTKILLTGFLAAATFAPIASAQRARIIIGGGFGGGFYGPAYYGPGWYGWYGPGFYGPYGYGGYRYAVPATGSVKIETKAKSSSVYVDGAFAGTVGDLKTFHLKTGEHDIELRAPDGHSFYQEHINVLGGRTLKLTPGN